MLYLYDSTEKDNTVTILRTLFSLGYFEEMSSKLCPQEDSNKWIKISIKYLIWVKFLHSSIVLRFLLSLYSVLDVLTKNVYSVTTGWATSYLSDKRWPWKWAAQHWPAVHLREYQSVSVALGDVNLDNKLLQWE